MPTVPFLGSYGDISGGGLPFRNKLINGDFRVWQRGTSFSSLASYAYHADRWLADGAVTSVNRSGTQNNVLTVVTQAGTGIAQRIETAGGQFVAGQVYTVSALVNCSVADLTITVTYRDSNTFKATLLSANVSSQVTTGSYVKVSSTFTLANSPTDFANTNCIQVSFTSSVVNTINFQNVQFESGSVATPFEVRPIGTELALCQRYCILLTSASNQEISRMSVYTVGAMFFAVALPVTMRSQPSFSSGTLEVVSTSNTAQTGFVFATNAGGVSGNLTTVTASKASHGLTDSFLRGTNVILSAEL